MMMSFSQTLNLNRIQIDPNLLSSRIISALYLIYPKEEITDDSVVIDSVDLLCQGNTGERFSKVKFTLATHPEQRLVWFLNL
jgi:hypothetical protein